MVITKQMSVIIRYYDYLMNSPVKYFICIKQLTAVDPQYIFVSLSFIIEKQSGLSWLDVITMTGSANGV